MSLEHSELWLLATSAGHQPGLNLVVLEHLMVAFQVDTQVRVKQATEFVVVIAVAVRLNIDPPLMSCDCFCPLCVDSASHPARVATIVGLELADSNLAVVGLMLAGLSIDDENQYLYKLTWKSNLVSSNLVFLEYTGIARSIVDHLAIVLMTYFYLGNLFVSICRQVDPT